MCLTTSITTKKKPKPKIARKDIPVFKLLNEDKTSIYRDLVIGSRKPKTEAWTPGFQYTETTPFVGMTQSLVTGAWRIRGNAFHSLTHKEHAERMWNSRRILVEMVIPKGAKYFISGDGKEYASSSIIYPYSKEPVK